MSTHRRRLLAAVAETLSLGAPGIQRAQGPLSCVLALLYEALQGCVYVYVCVSVFVYLCAVPTHVADCWAVVFQGGGGPLSTRSHPEGSSL